MWITWPLPPEAASRHPVPGLPPFMRDRKHGRQVTFAHEDDLIGEIRYRQLPNIRIVDAENGTTGMRKTLKQLQRLVNLIEESRCQLGIAFAVPQGCIAQIAFRGR